MSQEKVEIVRKPLRVRGQSSRALEQRLFVRFPRLADIPLHLISRLAPTSRLRQSLLWRGIRLSVEAFNRRDLEALSPSRYADFEFYPPPELVEAGFVEASYRGDAGYRTYLSEAFEVWGDDMQVEPVDLIDLGDRLVVLYNVPMRARASGVPLTGQLATVAVLKHGKVTQQRDYLDHAQALEAAGLRE